MSVVTKFLNQIEYASILQSLVQKNTSQPEGNEMDLVKHILTYFSKEKLDYQILDHGKNRGSLIITIPGKNKDKAIGFFGHIDTVTAGNESDWKYPPFSGTIEGHYMYGRGTADMKGGVAAMILTALYFIENNIVPQQALIFGFTADEETDGLGILAMTKSEKLKNLCEVVISEPSREQLGLAEKGALWLKIIANGKLAHGSMPNMGINAVENLIELIDRIRKKLNFREDHYLLGRATISLTKMSGGIMSNVIPEQAEATLDIRTTPDIDHKDILESCRDLVEVMKNEVPGLGFTISVENNRPAIETSVDKPLIVKMQKIMKSLGMNTEERGLHFYTDGSQLIPEYNVPFVILGPGDDSNAHQRDENIEVESVRRIAEVYIRYLLDKEK